MLQPEQWREIRDYTSTIVNGVTPEETSALPLLLRHDFNYSWPSEGGNVDFNSTLFRMLPWGNREAYRTQTYSLLTRSGGGKTFRRIHFSPHTEAITMVSSGMVPQTPRTEKEKNRANALYAKRSGEGYWSPRPKDYTRLYEELGKGALYIRLAD